MTETKYTLRDAFIEAKRIKLSGIPKDEDIDWTPSPRFERKINRLIKNSRKSYWPLINTPLKKVAVAAMVIIMLFGFTMSIEAAREAVVDYIITVYEKYTGIFFDVDDKDLNVPKTIEQKYMVTALPEGYTLSSKDEMDFRRKFIWTNEKGEDIIFEQSVLHNTSMTLDTEDAPFKYVKVGQYTAIYSTKRNMQTVIWDNGKYLFIINCTTSVSYEDVIRMAESVTEE